MITELTPKERAAVLRMIKEKHPGAGPNADVEGFFKIKPLAFHFFAMAARGLLKDRRAATDVYLRSLPDNLFEQLTLALRDFNSDENDDDDRRGPDLVLVLIILLGGEKRVDSFQATDEEMAMYMGRLGALAAIEVERRAGVWRWVDRYTLLKPTTEKQPRRMPAV